MGFWRIKGPWNSNRVCEQFSGVIFVPVFEPQQLCENKVAVAAERGSPHTPFSNHSNFIFVKALKPMVLDVF